MATSAKSGFRDDPNPTPARRRRVVLLTPVAPAPTGYGLAMRAAMLAGAFADDDLITVALPIASDAAWVEVNGRREPLPDLEPVARTSLRLMGQPTWRDRLALLNALPRMAQRVPLGLASPLAAGLVNIDVIVCLRSYLVPFAALLTDELRRRSATNTAPALVVDLDDDDASTFRQLGDEDAERFDPMIAGFAPWVAAFVAANEAEADALSARLGRAVSELPNGIAIPPEPAARRRDGDLVMVANFGYRPNVDGARWFLDRVVAELGPVARGRRVVFVGQGSEGLAPPVDAGIVEVLGFQPELAPVYANAALVIVPLHHGGGTRIKILEAAAHGVPIVSTSVGASGLGWHDPDELRIADSPEGFAEAIEETLVAHSETERRVRSARERVAAHDVSLVARRFRNDVEAVCASGGIVVP